MRVLAILFSHPRKEPATQPLVSSPDFFIVSFISLPFPLLEAGTRWESSEYLPSARMNEKNSIQKRQCTTFDTQKRTRA